jgi:hypothetical protein
MHAGCDTRFRVAGAYKCVESHYPVKATVLTLEHSSRISCPSAGVPHDLLRCQASQVTLTGPPRIFKWPPKPPALNAQVREPPGRENASRMVTRTYTVKKTQPRRFDTPGYRQETDRTKLLVEIPSLRPRWTGGDQEQSLFCP